MGLPTRPESMHSFSEGDIIDGKIITSDVPENTPAIDISAPTLVSNDVPTNKTQPEVDVPEEIIVDAEILIDNEPKPITDRKGFWREIANPSATNRTNWRTPITDIDIIAATGGAFTSTQEFEKTTNRPTAALPKLFELSDNPHTIAQLIADTFNYQHKGERTIDGDYVLKAVADSKTNDAPFLFEPQINALNKFFEANPTIFIDKQNVRINDVVKYGRKSKSSAEQALKSIAGMKY